MVRIITDALTVGVTMYRAGQVVEDPSDGLLALARDPRNRHVELVESKGPALPIEGGAGSTLGGDGRAYTPEALGELSRDELREIAKEFDADVAGNASKAAFIDAILAQQSKDGEG